MKKCQPDIGLPFGPRRLDHLGDKVPFQIGRHILIGEPRGIERHDPADVGDNDIAAKFADRAGDFFWVFQRVNLAQIGLHDAIGLVPSACRVSTSQPRPLRQSGR